MISITVNGKNREINSGLNVTELLAVLGLIPQKIAVELNREIVPKSLFATTIVNQGDQIEIVQFVGGG